MRYLRLILALLPMLLLAGCQGMTLGLNYTPPITVGVSLSWAYRPTPSSVPTTQPATQPGAPR